MANKLINNSNPDEMLKISKKIATYADNLKRDMKKLLNTHQGMHTSWSGKQYDDFSKAIEDADKVIKEQSEKLLAISKDVENDAKQLKIALGTGAR
ncbi:MAG: WXG100 family type VII secretion target [Clostridia bacterium]|nr:WXG100 family type VII secretion target [Clostridia bacterium]